MLLKRGVTGEEYSAELSFVCCSSGTQYLEVASGFLRVMNKVF